MWTSVSFGSAVAQQHPEAFDVLAAFVAINTLMYVSLALVKLLPRIRVPSMMRRRYSRTETRSIYPPEPLD